MTDEITLEFSPEMVSIVATSRDTETDVQPTGGCCNSGGSCKISYVAAEEE